MFKSKKGIVAMAIMGGMLVQATPAFAVEPASGDTEVTYDNRQVLPDGNGQYGIIIPTAVAFADDAMSGSANLEITGIEGFDLKDWKELKVEANVQSENEYQLKLNGTDSSKYAVYSLTYDEQEITSNDETSTSTASNATKINKALGVSTNTPDSVSAVVEGTANLKDKSKATEKGQYKDTLTYSFKEVTNEKK